MKEVEVPAAHVVHVIGRARGVSALVDPRTPYAAMV